MSRVTIAHQVLTVLHLPSPAQVNLLYYPFKLLPEITIDYKKMEDLNSGLRGQ